MTATRALALAVAVPLLAVPGHAAAPLPRPKPPRAGITAPATPIAVPFPRSKPKLKLTPKSAVAPAKPWPADFGSWSISEVREARAHCMALLATRNLIWRPDNPIGAPGGCGTPAPIAIAEISNVRINPPATINCDFAAALADWIDGTVQPLAR